ncbi:hypothetical protein [Methyloglobulus sp.]|uniref:hypothetical protein n=1 Tax=Methyloglobulus sp. TaxID=2518622 RepID=UPI0032B84229
MNEQERNDILEKVKTWFRTVIIPNHIKNTLKLAKPSEFDINPFLVPYIAAFDWRTHARISGQGAALSQDIRFFDYHLLWAKHADFHFRGAGFLWVVSAWDRY